MKLLLLESTLSESWTLSADGKTLLNRRHLKSPIGSGDQTLVFERR
jgi:hypothetical protein